MAAARTGQGETPIQHIRMSAELWDALKTRAKEVDGVSGPEVMRRLAVRYVLGEIKAGSRRELPSAAPGHTEGTTPQD